MTIAGFAFSSSPTRRRAQMLRLSSAPSPDGLARLVRDVRSDVVEAAIAGRGSEGVEREDKPVGRDWSPPGPGATR